MYSGPRFTLLAELCIASAIFRINAEEIGFLVFVMNNLWRKILSDMSRCSFPPLTTVDLDVESIGVSES